MSTVNLGSASILIDLTGGRIVVRHGTDGDILGEKKDVKEGDWDRLWDFLTEDFGVVHRFAANKGD